MSKNHTPNAIVFLGIIICIGIGLAMSWAGGDNGLQVGSLSLFFLCGMLGFVLHWLAFIPAYIYQTEHYFDLTGSLSFIATILVANWLIVDTSPTENIRSLLLSFMVLTWAIRLGAFLFSRVRSSGEDSRFRDIKPRFFRFLFTWTLGGLWVLITVAAALAAISSGRNVSIGITAYFGVALWLLGFLFETIADRQKTAFRANPDNKGQFIRSGLWSISRHPNYFGEMTLWIGVAIVAAPALQGWQYLSLVSPVFVILLICRVSGIPLLESQASEKWGDDPHYKQYVQNTPVLIPGLKPSSKSTALRETTETPEQ